MAIRVFVESAKGDKEMVDWVIRNCKGFLYSIATYQNPEGQVDIELFFATEEDAVLFNLRYL